MSTATQAHIPIANLEEGVVILKDGSLAVVLRIYPINFDLKNESEQNTIINRYQQFLNSLEYPIQILVRSRQLDLRPYLADLTKRTAALESELLKRQAEDYIKFMEGLVEVASSENQRLMTKQYYVVLQYQHVSVSGGGGGLPFLHHNAEGATLTRGEFERIRTELNNRANNVAGMLLQLGLRIEALDTLKLIELFNSIYNPDSANSEHLDIAALQAGVVHAEGQVAAPAPAGPAVSAETTPPLVPGATGDSITLTPTGSAHVTETANVAEVPEAAKKAASKDTTKLPHAPTTEPAPTVTPAPGQATPPAPATSPAPAPAMPKPEPTPTNQPVDLNIPPR